MSNLAFSQNLPNTLYRAEQVRELDRIAIQDYGIPSLTLMTRAAQAAFDLLQKFCPQAHSIVVFCGSGNNAGDGYILAQLALLANMQVKVISLTPRDKLSGDALLAYQAYLLASGKVIDFYARITIDADVIVDALLGTGLNRPLAKNYDQAVAAINLSHCPVLSLDIPSGLQANTGWVMNKAVKADHTLTFIGLKQGMFTSQAADYCGQIYYASLACPDQIFEQVNTPVETITCKPLPVRQRCAHKGNHGHVLLIGGDIAYTGAIRLAAVAAARSGAGLISIATRSIHANLLNINQPEFMCHGTESTQQLRPLLARAKVIAIGPGLGQSMWAETLLINALATGKPMVVDADALNLLADKPQSSEQWVLTPHPGEAARLLDCSISEIEQDRFLAVSTLQRTFGGVVILKGAGTLITDGQKTFVATSGNPGMASAGMGDLLTGIIAALLAQDCSLIEGAVMAVDIHGKAGDRAAKAGERGLLASDLLHPIRQLVNDL